MRLERLYLVRRGVPTVNACPCVDSTLLSARGWLRQTSATLRSGATERHCRSRSLASRVSLRSIWTNHVAQRIAVGMCVDPEPYCSLPLADLCEPHGHTSASSPRYMYNPTPKRVLSLNHTTTTQPRQQSYSCEPNARVSLSPHSATRPPSAQGWGQGGLRPVPNYSPNPSPAATGLKSCTPHLPSQLSTPRWSLGKPRSKIAVPLQRHGGGRFGGRSLVYQLHYRSLTTLALTRALFQSRAR